MRAAAAMGWQIVDVRPDDTLAVQSQLWDFVVRDDIDDRPESAAIIVLSRTGLCHQTGA